MVSREELKARVAAEIDARADELVGIATKILENPEPGFREVKTSSLVGQTFRELKIRHRRDLAVTGVKG